MFCDYEGRGFATDYAMSVESAKFYRVYYKIMRDAQHAYFQKLAPDLGWIENIAAKYGTLADTP